MAEKITITINTSNGAFEEDPNEVATSLLKTAAKFAGVGQDIEQFDGDRSRHQRQLGGRHHHHLGDQHEKRGKHHGNRQDASSGNHRQVRRGH